MPLFCAFHINKNEETYTKIFELIKAGMWSNLIIKQE